MNNVNILTISQLNFYVKSLLESDNNLRSVFIRGEISNLTDHYKSGHIYLTLKDDKCALKAVMFSGNARYLKFRPENGMSVLVRGRVSLYDATGTYQLYIDDMQPDGIGTLNLAFEKLKKKLLQEGIFDKEHKKPLPEFPKRIGVITSPTGAAVQDIFRILKRRYPIGEVIMYPVLVQGESAAVQLIEAVRKFNRLKCADVIIIGRGGGSIEDLWAFNDEGLAREIYSSEIPIVSAVGHETDFTICDFAADVRASTPSAAAEIVTPEKDEMLGAVLFYRERIKKIMSKRLDEEKRRVLALSNSRVLRAPSDIVKYRSIKLDMLTSSLKNAYVRDISLHKSKLSALSAGLDMLSPLKVLSRGYSAALKNDKIIVSKNDVVSGDKIELILSDGRIGCTVDDILEEK